MQNRLTSFVLLLVSVLFSAHACLCPLPLGGQDPFTYAYRQAGTVVKALVVDSKTDSKCDSPPCLGEGDLFDLQGTRTFTLKLLRTFKGTPPPYLFKATSSTNAVQCGINLTVGKVYMLNMGGGFPGPYSLWLCQWNRLFSSLTQAQIDFLNKCAGPVGGPKPKLTADRALKVSSGCV